MADTPDRDEQTEAATPQRRAKAAETGDVLQSRELGTALVMLAGAGWLALAGGWMLRAMRAMLADGLSIRRADLDTFDSARTGARLLLAVAPPLLALFSLALIAAVAAPALLGAAGFRPGAFAFKPAKLNPLAGLRRMVGLQGLVELGKSIAKVALLGAVAWWLFRAAQAHILGAGAADPAAGLAVLGARFTLAVLALAGGLVAIAAIDVPAQVLQRAARLRMTRQEVKEEHRQSDGAPELKAAVRRRQHEMLRGSARAGVATATAVLTNPTHFAVALRYRPGEDAVPVVVARGRGAAAAAIRELAAEHRVPVLSYPQLARAIYFTAREADAIREDLYVAVATVLAFVLNLEAALAAGRAQPAVEVPLDARFDEHGRRGA